MSGSLSCGDGFINPFENPPYPNAIRVGFGEGNTVSFCEILSNGDVEFYDDPLGQPVLTLKPEMWEVMKFIASHLENYFVDGKSPAPVEKVIALQDGVPAQRSLQEWVSK